MSVLSLLLAISLNLVPLAHNTHRADVVTYASCNEMAKAGFISASARDNQSRTKYLDTRNQSGLGAVQVVVRPKIYKQNAHLDDDKNGVICERQAGNRAALNRAFDAIKCENLGKQYVPSLGLCL